MTNKNILKSYAPEARKEFIKAVTERAAFYGIADGKTLPCEIKGDFAFIAGKPFPKNIDQRRKSLVERVQRAGFAQTMEEIAYTWFNRFMAIRFMEVNGYLAHGYRVLSHPAGNNEPEILEKAQFITKLGGLDKDEILKLKMAVGKEGELYRRLILAQCSDLHDAMPFLFERVDDPTELLLPDNLLNTDSLVRKIVTSIPEEDWKEVEIIGWLYQFYISERKDELMKAKKAYKAEEIPAVTQLFTPNWIVKYLVQNALGAKWLATYPKSALKAKMAYYIAPAEQSEDVKAKIKEITPTSLNPEDLTIMDPACGSGHILVEAYELLKEIYLERGYRVRDIAGLILTKNLFGLEIDERAAQLAGFALLMRACADDREMFSKGIKPNIICLKESNKVSVSDICRNIESAYSGQLSSFRKDKLAFMDEVDLPLFTKQTAENRKNQGQNEVITIIQKVFELFHDAKTFGSLIKVPEELIRKLPDLLIQLDKKAEVEDWMIKSSILEVIPFVRQAEILSKRYDCVIANPPYMGGKGINGTLRAFINDVYQEGKQDLYGCFMLRCLEFSRDHGYVAMITIPNWMFLSSFESLRRRLLTETTFCSLVHNGRGVWGSDFGSCSFVIQNAVNCNMLAVFKRLFKRQGEVSVNEELALAFLNEVGFPSFKLSSTDLQKIPGAPIAYWVSDEVRKVFKKTVPLSTLALPKQGLATGDNDQFRRNWTEVDYSKIGFSGYSVSKKWFPYN
ncbi:MAG: BREX-1 system adenine-specific DNA-methyltransferase PglX, partial [Candidatus Omnitrophica bacterium]|nr:BREX-1 system adenine-specific DNA-methyltransferase PglX [Candidatus Omnitrophota bacterium]